VAVSPAGLPVSAESAGPCAGAGTGTGNGTGTGADAALVAGAVTGPATFPLRASIATSAAAPKFDSAAMTRLYVTPKPGRRNAGSPIVPQAAPAVLIAYARPVARPTS